jgi:hypothetical protein
VFAHACRLGAEGTVRSGSTAPINPARAASGLRSAIPPASPCSGSGARIGADEPPDEDWPVGKSDSVTRQGAYKWG